ncbi:MAG: hypothetical protein AAFQ63_13150 [Cyanobacteria bacterium J06621_11]
MTQNHTTKRLLLTLILSSLAFLISGTIIQQFTGQTLTLLIDRSYCPAAQWQHLSQEYAQLYQQHQRKQITLQTVVLFSDLSQTVHHQPPTPAAIQALKTYGQSSQTAQTALQQDYPTAKLLNCQL